MPPEFSLFERVGVTGPWDECVAALAKEKLIVSSVEEIIQRRVDTDRAACQEGAWTAENFNYMTNGTILVAGRDSNPLIAEPREARLAHERHREYYLSDEASENLQAMAEEDMAKEPEVRRVFILPKSQSFVVTLLGLPHDEFLRFLAKTALRHYRDLLKKQGAMGMRIQVLDPYYVRKQKAPFAKALWFDDVRSGFVGNTDLTHYHPGRIYGTKP